MKTLLSVSAGQLPKVVMFDLDGTLIDSVPDLATATDSMLEQLGRAPAGMNKVRHWVGNGAPVLVRRALADNFDHQASLPSKKLRHWQFLCKCMVPVRV